MATPRFIKDDMRLLYELGYRPKGKIIDEEFINAFHRTFVRCMDIEDCYTALRFFFAASYELKNLKKLYPKYKDYIDNYELDDYHRRLLLCEEGKEPRNHFTFTNVLTYTPTELAFISALNKEPLIVQHDENGYYDLSGKYSLKYLEGKRMSVLEGERIMMDIIMRTDGVILVKNNVSDIALVNNDSLLELYPRKYIESLPKGKRPLKGKLVGEIEWDMIDEEELWPFGFARLKLYDPDYISMAFLVAMSTFLLEIRLREEEGYGKEYGK